MPNCNVFSRHSDVVDARVLIYALCSDPCQHSSSRAQQIRKPGLPTSGVDTSIDTMSGPRAIAHIPSEVVVLVLQHIEVNQRLTVCALVSQAWRAAAAAATTSINTTCESPVETQQLLQYLEQQGSSVEHLKLCSSELQPLQAPWQGCLAAACSA